MPGDRVERKLKAVDVIDVLSDLYHPARCARAHPFGQWPRVHRQGRAGLDRGRRCEGRYIEPGSPWENGFVESFNARLRDELLDGEIFYSLAERRS